jgi:hypothetical protein
MMMVVMVMVMVMVMPPPSPPAMMMVVNDDGLRHARAVARRSVAHARIVGAQGRERIRYRLEQIAVARGRRLPGR